MGRKMGRSSRGLSPNSLDLDDNRMSGLPPCFYGSSNAFSVEAPSQTNAQHMYYTRKRLKQLKG